MQRSLARLASVYLNQKFIFNNKRLLTNVKLKNLNFLEHDHSHHQENNNENNSNHKNKNAKNLFLSILMSVSLVSMSNNYQNNNQQSRGARFNFIADVVEIVMPSVVHIEANEVTRFGQMAASNGSGFIVSDDGLILTNAHVIRNQFTVSVKLNDGRKVKGQVIKVDSLSDVAVIKIDCNNLKALQLEDSNNVRPGEFVIALGSPLTLTNTVTSGIVSSISRVSSELGLRNDMEYIQTDALITFGNSGGPLINLDGKVIGMNTMMLTTGIGFAVPSNQMKKIVEEAMQYRDKLKTERKDLVPMKRRYIGAKILSLNANMVARLRDQGLINVPDYVQNGVVIVIIAANSPAQR